MVKIKICICTMCIAILGTAFSGCKSYKQSRKQNQKLYNAIETNEVEAAKEAARQIRLRNLSGIIMIDFIDMKSKDDEKELLQVMQHYLNDDSKKAVAVDITKLGIMEITRKKEKNPIFRQISIDILE